MKNSSVGDYVAQTMDAITKTAAHRELFGLKKLAEEKCKECDKPKEDCKCSDANDASDTVVIKDPLVVKPGEPKPNTLSDSLKADDFAASDETLETAAGFDVAIDSLLTASAALDDLGMEKTATLSLKLAELVVEAKKTEKGKSKEDKEKEKAKKAKEKEKLDEMKAKDKAAKDKLKEKAAKEKEAEKAKKTKEKQKADEMKAKDKAAKDKDAEKMAKLRAAKDAKDKAKK